VDIKYGGKKSDLKRDPLLEWLVEAKKSLSENSRTIGFVVGGAAAVVLVFLLFTQMRSSAVRHAQEAFGKAMTTYTGGMADKALEEFTAVANEHKGTPHAVYSAYIVGNMLLERGRYDEAIAWLELASKEERRGGLVSSAALEGLSAAYEGKGDYEQALEYIRKALADKRMAYRYPALRWKMALLCAETKQYGQVESLCREIVADTLAAGYHQKARNLLVEVGIGESS
jgi:tetratricopeptide (TPR) repeat protein